MNTLIAAVSEMRVKYDWLDAETKEGLRTCGSHAEVRRSRAFKEVVVEGGPLWRFTDADPALDALVPLLVFFRRASHKEDPSFAFGKVLRHVREAGIYPDFEGVVHEALYRRTSPANRIYALSRLVRMVHQLGHTVDWGRLGAEILLVLNDPDARESCDIMVEWARRLWGPQSEGSLEDAKLAELAP